MSAQNDPEAGLPLSQDIHLFGTSVGDWTGNAIHPCMIRYRPEMSRLTSWCQFEDCLAFWCPILQIKLSTSYAILVPYLGCKSGAIKHVQHLILSCTRIYLSPADVWFPRRGLTGLASCTYLLQERDCWLPMREEEEEEKKECVVLGRELWLQSPGLSGFTEIIHHRFAMAIMGNRYDVSIKIFMELLT